MMNPGALLDISSIMIKFMDEKSINTFLSINKTFRKLKNLIIWKTDVEMSKVIMLDYSDRFRNITFGIWDKSIYKNSLKRYPQLTFNEMISLCFKSSQTITIKTCVGIRVVKCNWTNLNLDRKLNFMYQLIPKSITHYNFDFNYGPGSQEFNCVKYVPLSVTHLTFGINFISTIINIPIHLKYLKINSADWFNIVKLGKIPTLEYLSVRHDFVTDEIYPLVKILKINRGRPSIDIEKSFPSVTHLTIYKPFFYPNDIPQSLKFLYLHNCHNICMDIMPHHVTHLKFDHNFNRNVNINPECVSIIFGKTFNQPIKPESLGHLGYLKLSSEYKFMDDVRQFFKGTLDIY
jgi:hypothetical protein